MNLSFRIILAGYGFYIIETMLGYYSKKKNKSRQVKRNLCYTTVHVNSYGFRYAMIDKLVI